MPGVAIPKDESQDLPLEFSNDTHFGNFHVLQVTVVGTPEVTLGPKVVN